MKIFTVLLFVALLASHAVFAQDSNSPSSSKTLMEKFEGKTREENQNSAPKTSYDLNYIIALNKNVAEKQNEYQIFVYQNRMETFQWQMFTTKVIFFVVIFIVILGVFTSIVQFYHSVPPSSLIQRIKKPDPNDAETPATAPTELEVSLSGVKIKSQLIGVVIFAMSIVFFYLYVANVYPITEVKEAAAPEPKQSAAR